MPGIMAFQFYGDAIMEKAGGDLSKAGELAYPHMIAEIMPSVLRGVMLAALSGRGDEHVQLGDQLSVDDLHDRRLQALHQPQSTPRDQVRVGQITTV
jgi:hypothetical protein